MAIAKSDQKNGTIIFTGGTTLTKCPELLDHYRLGQGHSRYVGFNDVNDVLGKR